MGYSCYPHYIGHDVTKDLRRSRCGLPNRISQQIHHKFSSISDGEKGNLMNSE